MFSSQIKWQADLLYLICLFVCFVLIAALDFIQYYFSISYCIYYCSVYYYYEIDFNFSAFDMFFVIFKFPFLF